MSQPLHPRYRFATEAQWRACRFLGAGQGTKARSGLRPFAPYGLPPKTIWEAAGRSPALTDEAELLWLDNQGMLARLPYGDEKPRTVTAPATLRTASRVVATPGTLWARAADGTVQAFDSESLSRLFVVSLDPLEAADIAWDSHDSVYVLATGQGRVEVVHLDCAGNVDLKLVPEETIDARAIAYLGEAKKIVLLGADGSRLHFLDATDGRLVRTVFVSALRTCFDPCIMVSDGCARLFIAGADGKARDERPQPQRRPQIVLTDADGNLLGVAPVESRVTGLTATRSQLFATTDESVLQFNPAAKVPQGWGEIRASVVTPPLRSPAKGPQKWIRIEATVELPPGCSLEISWAAAGDEARHTSTYHGGPADTGRKSMILSAPLHDVQAESITVEVSLTAAPGGGLPALSDLSVLYPGPTLVEHLPAIYRSRELESGDVLRGLVGVLEAGTQQLDASIGDLGRNIHPDTADADWLDYVASWLGLPWDNALTIEQKRRLVGHASAIAEGYGTRAGLEALLDSLFPQQPRGFRIVDATVDYGLATVAGEGCEGSRLPAMLGGYPNSATVLGTRAILGKACLPGDDQEGETARLLGKIRIDIEASAEERKAWEPWLKGVIDAMLPAAAQSELRWLLKGGLSAARVGDDARLEADPEAHLGTDAVTGKARLGGRRRTVVPDRLTRNSTLQ